MHREKEIKAIDSHSHSNFSPDSAMTIKEAWVAAYSAGLGGVAITDHLDLNAPGGDTRFFFDVAEQHRAIEEAQQESPITIYKGIEIGLQPTNLHEVKEFVKGHSFDTVIASVHFVDGLDPYAGEYYHNKSEKEAYGRYLELLVEMVKEYPDFDILGHYDYIARYAPYQKFSLFYREYSDLLDTLLRYLIYNGKALELNTNTYRTRNGRTITPDPDLYKRFVELGGELLSISSDAHTPNRFGEEFKKFISFAQSCGVRYITHFDKRKAVPQRIDYILNSLSPF